MYEAYVDENKKLIETGNILFANLILSGKDNSLIMMRKKMLVTMIKMEKVSKRPNENSNNGARLSSPLV